MARRFLFFNLFTGMRILGFISFVFGVSTLIISGWIFVSNHFHVESDLFTSPIVLAPKLTSTSTWTIPNPKGHSHNEFQDCTPYTATTTTRTSVVPTINDTNENQHSYDVFGTLKESLIRCCIVVVILALVQIISAAIILGSPVQGCHGRVKLWFIINAGLNIAILICLTMPLMYQLEHSSHLQIIRLDSTSGTVPMHITGAAKSTTTNANECNGTINNWNGSSSGLTKEPATITHLDAYYIGLGTNFLVQFVTLIISFLLLRFNRSDSNNSPVSYEHVAESI